MAELASNNKEYEKAINFYKESLAYDETYTQVWGCYSMEHISDLCRLDKENKIWYQSSW